MAASPNLGEIITTTLRNRTGKPPTRFPRTTHCSLRLRKRARWSPLRWPHHRSGNRVPGKRHVQAVCRLRPPEHQPVRRSDRCRIRLETGRCRHFHLGPGADAELGKEVMIKLLWKPASATRRRRFATTSRSTAIRTARRTAASRSAVCRPRRHSRRPAPYGGINRAAGRSGRTRSSQA
jgi:hypothetical protein